MEDEVLKALWNVFGAPLSGQRENCTVTDLSAFFFLKSFISFPLPPFFSFTIPRHHASHKASSNYWHCAVSFRISRFPGSSSVRLPPPLPELIPHFVDTRPIRQAAEPSLNCPLPTPPPHSGLALDSELIVSVQPTREASLHTNDCLKTELNSASSCLASSVYMYLQCFYFSIGSCFFKLCLLSSSFSQR